MKRQANIELLRVVCMILIMLHHFNSYLYTGNVTVSSYLCSFMDIINKLGNFHVDAFILISGYFGIKNSQKAFIKTLKVILFYLFLTNIVTVLVGGTFDWFQILNPIQESPWWFMCNYMYLILLAPYINMVCDSLHTKQSWYRLLGIALLFNCYFCWFLFDPQLNFYGHNLTTFIVVYIIGRFLKSEYSQNVTFKLRQFGGGSFCCAFIVSILFTGLASIINHCLNLELRFLDYNSPFTLLNSITVFLMFNNWILKPNRTIFFLSESAVAVYMVHSNLVFGGYIERGFYYAFSILSHINSTLLLPILYALVIYLIITCFDKLRININDCLAIVFNKISIFHI